MASGEWRVASGEWRVASGEWRVASGEWRVASGDWRSYLQTSITEVKDRSIKIRGGGDNIKIRGGR